jgi:SOS-response transcriptional repressor LexA
VLPWYQVLSHEVKVAKRDFVDGLAAKLVAARAAAKLSQLQASEASSVPRTMISQFEIGAKTPTLATLIKLAGAYGVDPINFTPVSEVPLLGAIAAGPFPVTSQEADEVEYLNFSKRYPANAFALRVQGHSVTRFGVWHDDVIVVRPASEPEEGALIVIRQEGSHTLKGYTDGLVVSYSDDAPPRIVQLDDDAEIIGVLIDTIGPRFVSPPKKMKKKRAR